MSDESKLSNQFKQTQIRAQPSGNSITKRVKRLKTWLFEEPVKVEKADEIKKSIKKDKAGAKNLLKYMVKRKLEWDPAKKDPETNSVYKELLEDIAIYSKILKIPEVDMVVEIKSEMSKSNK